MLTIRPAARDDDDAVWAILEPVIRAGETYALDRDMGREAALAMWHAPEKQVFVAEVDGAVLGTFYLRANQPGGGSHVANAGFMVASAAQGCGVARAMAQAALDQARALRFAAMQFNFVVSANASAATLWQKMGFVVVGVLPRAFSHPRLGLVDVFVMWRDL